MALTLRPIARARTSARASLAHGPWYRARVEPLADNGAWVLAEQGERLFFFRRRGLVPAYAVFVAALLTFICAVQAAVLPFIPGGSATAGLIALAVAVVTGGLLVLFVRWRRAALERPLDPRHAVLVLDRAANQVTDAAGTRLAALDQLRFEKAFQLASSARMLVAVWPGGWRIVYRGDWFSGLLDAPLDALTARGLRCGE